MKVLDVFHTLWTQGNGMERAASILIVAVIILNILKIALLVYDCFFRGTDDDDQKEVKG